jgi:hypothetical protein
MLSHPEVFFSAFILRRCSAPVIPTGAAWGIRPELRGKQFDRHPRLAGNLVRSEHRRGIPLEHLAQPATAA